MSNETAAPAAATPPELTFRDLDNVLKIIDAAASRGAFRGAELESVGQTRNRIAAVVDFVNKQNAPADEVQEPEAPVEEKKSRRGKK